MYANPEHIRKKRYGLSLNKTESRIVDAIAEFNGKEPSVFIRDLILDFIERGGCIDHGLNPNQSPEKLRATS